MPFCPHCGTQVAQSANFCPNCGKNLATASAGTVVSPTVASGVNSVYTGDGYAVMLVSVGTATAAVAADLISDTCGYTDAEALVLVGNAPTLIAQNLTRQQAVYLSQCMTEYGLEAAIFDRTGNITLQSDVDTVFDANGSFLAGVAATLGLVGVANRIGGAVRRWTFNTRPVVYAPTRPVRRPPIRRQVIRRAPAPVPHPVPRAVVRPAPVPPRPAARPAPAQPVAPRPAGPASRPAGPSRPAPGPSRGSSTHPGGAGRKGRP